MSFFHDPYVRPVDAIERDPMFAAWTRYLPRLWYLDQRQATRLDAESLYGQARFAVFISRTHYEQLGPPIDTALVQNRIYLRTQVEGVGIPVDSNTRTISLNRPQSEVLAVPEDVGVALRPSDSPTTPPPHLVIADGKGDTQDTSEMLDESGSIIFTEDYNTMRVE